MNSIFGVYSYIIGVIIRKIDSFFVVQTIDAGVFLHKYSSLTLFYLFILSLLFVIYTSFSFIMSQTPKGDDIPSLLYPSLRDHRSLLDPPIHIASKLIKLRSKLRSPTHISLNLFNPRPAVNRVASLPNVSRHYDNEDESEIGTFIRPTFRYSQLVLPPKQKSSLHYTIVNDVLYQKTVSDDDNDSNQSLLSSCPTWSANEESDNEDDDTTVTLSRPATAILVSLPLSSAAAASVARSRRVKPTRVQSSPVINLK